MKVICAGASKTGTKSMASALRILGYTVHDADEQWSFHADEYIKAMESNEMPDFASMYAMVDAVTDSPANFYFEEISHAFPNAKVVLMIRDDEEVWLRSLLKTAEVLDKTMSRLWLTLGMKFTPTGRKIRRIFDNQTRIFLADSTDESHLNESLKKVYRKHNERVRSVIPQDRLLVYNAKQGWRPLCEFLGDKVPNVPFPRSNMNSDSIPELLTCSRTGRRIFNEVIFMTSVMFTVLAALVFMVFC